MSRGILFESRIWAEPDKVRTNLSHRRKFTLNLGRLGHQSAKLAPEFNELESSLTIVRLIRANFGWRNDAMGWTSDWATERIEKVVGQSVGVPCGRQSLGVCEGQRDARN